MSDHPCPRCGEELKKTGYVSTREEILAVCTGCGEHFQRRKTSGWYQVARPRLAPEKRKSIVVSARVSPENRPLLDEKGGAQAVIDEALGVGK